LACNNLNFIHKINHPINYKIQKLIEEKSV